MTFIMVNKTRQSTASQGGGNSRPLPTPLYSSVVVALAVFLLGLTLWRSPIEGYVVTAEITSSEVDGPKSPTATGADSQSVALNLQHIADAIRAADRQTNVVGRDEPARVVTEKRLSEIA